MNLSINISKITPPGFPHVLDRPRLVKRLQENQDRKLTLILGQGAQGKSTLAASYVQTTEIPSGWINLAYHDSEAVNLFYLLAYSLQQALTELDLSPALAYPTLSMGPREELPLYRDWLLALFNLVTVPVQAIFDGLDCLNVESSGFRFLQVLLDEAPPNLHFLMLSRELPPLDLQTLKMRRQAYIMSSEEVAFTLSETRAFLQQIKHLSLAPNLVGQIHRLTEGWAGGLVLLADLLERLPETARGDCLSVDLTNRFQGEIFPYFGEQIFSALPEQSQEFLIKSSIYDIISPDLLEGADGNPSAHDILEDLARRNLFVQSLYDRQKGWLYRYHQLFRDFLQTKFRTLLGNGQQEALFLQAGRLSEQTGEPEQAVKFYLQGQAYRQAASIIERIGMDLVKQGRTADLLPWLKAMPPDLVAENPWLLFYGFLARRLSGSAELILDLKQALALFQEQGDVSGSFLAMAYLLEALVLRGHPAIPNIHALLAQAEDLVQAAGAGRYPMERAILWFQIGFAHYIRSGKPRKGLWACQHAYLLARDLGDLPLQISALTYAHGVFSVLGEFARSAEVIEQVDKLLEKHPHPDLEALHLIHIGQFHWFQGNADQGALAIRQARQKIEAHGLSFLLLPAMLYDHLIKTMHGEYREAEEIGHSLVQLAFAMEDLWAGSVPVMVGSEPLPARGI